jgi:hypothetical protein
MAERPIAQLTLRDIFSETEWLIRELSEHLKQSFHPKSRALNEMVRSSNLPDARDQIADSAIRIQAAAVIASDEYSQTLIQKLDRYLKAIEERSQEALGSK